MLLCVAMVSSVSASSVKITLSRFNSSSVRLQASALAMAVMEAVNSHEFTRDSPPTYYMNMQSECVWLLLFKFEYQFWEGFLLYRFRLQIDRITSCGEWIWKAEKGRLRLGKAKPACGGRLGLRPRRPLRQGLLAWSAYAALTGLAPAGSRRARSSLYIK